MAHRVPTSAAFKAWFGASKVVDHLGRPLRVYHGTESAGFDTFGSGGWRRIGFFFSDDPKVAWTYTRSDTFDIVTKKDRRVGEPAIYEVYLYMERPLVVDAGGALWDNISANRLGHNERDVRKALGDHRSDSFITEDLASAASVLGYDGLIVKNVVDHNEGDWALGDPISTVYVVFDAHQIKSANMNSGKYSLTDASILKNPRRSGSRQRGLDVRRGIPGTYRTRYTTEGGKVRAYPAHDGAEWDRTMTRLATETTVAGNRIYDTVKRAEQAGRATVPGKRGAVEVVRVTNPQRRPVYHLTYASDLPSIARQGLVPRADTETAWNNAPGVYFVSTFGYEAGSPESEEPAWLCFPAPAMTPPRFFDGGLHEACVNATIPPEVIKVWVDERGRPVSSSDKGRWKPLVR